MAHAELTRVYITVELEDGSILEDLRVLFADQAAFAKTARINKWNTDDAGRQQAFLAWRVATRAGHISSTFEEFEAKELLDMNVAEVRASQDATENPTQAS